MSVETKTQEHKVVQAGADDLGFELPPPAKMSGGRGRRVIASAVIVVAAAFGAGFLPRFLAQRALAAETASEGSALPRVELVSPAALTSDRDLKLPGSIEALEQTVIYPRSQGYVKRWLVDLGSKVKEGELLAEIDTPELDSQLEQAKAQEAQAEADIVRAQANYGYSKTNLDRYEHLAPAGIASQQELDQHHAQEGVDGAGVTVAKATMNAQSANVRRLQQLKSFSKVTAPFAGTIVNRSVERGALVTPGVTPLFKLASIDTVRVMVQVPQDVAPSVQTTLPAKVTVREYSGRVFEGIIAHTAGALDDSARTMSVEVRVPNVDGKLLTGMYAQVALTLPTPHKLYEIPVTALYQDSKGTRVATVGAENKVLMRPISIERDTGQTLQISTGLDGSERIVKLANAGLSDGSRVEIFVPEKPVAAPEKK